MSPFFRLRYPVELEWLEGATLDHVRRVLTDAPLSARPSLDFMHEFVGYWSQHEINPKAYSLYASPGWLEHQFYVVAKRSHPAAAKLEALCRCAAMTLDRSREFAGCHATQQTVSMRFTGSITLEIDLKHYRHQPRPFRSAVCKTGSVVTRSASNIVFVVRQRRRTATLFVGGIEGIAVALNFDETDGQRSRVSGVFNFTRGINDGNHGSTPTGA